MADSAAGTATPEAGVVAAAAAAAAGSDAAAGAAAAGGESSPEAKATTTDQGKAPAGAPETYAAFTLPDAQVVADVAAALAAAASAPRLMVIGGAEVYAQTLAQAARIHLTQVHTRVADGDAFFSGWRHGGWSETGREEHGADARHAHAFSFVTLERRAP